MPELTDEKVMYLVKSGELSELRKLFDRYHISIYNFFLRLTANTETSEDLTQSLFYRLIRYRHSYKEENGSVRTWMYQIARNIHVDYCKEASRLSKVIKNVDNYTEEVAEKTVGYDQQDFEQLKKAMNELKPADRELIVLSRYEGFKYAEIARMKNLSLSAVKVQIHRALKKLKVLYFKQEEDCR